jgi:hypothetical protein
LLAIVGSISFGFSTTEIGSTITGVGSTIFDQIDQITFIVCFKLFHSSISVYVLSSSTDISNIYFLPCGFRIKK